MLNLPNVSATFMFLEFVSKVAAAASALSENKCTCNYYFEHDIHIIDVRTTQLPIYGYDMCRQGKYSQNGETNHLVGTDIFCEYGGRVFEDVT